MEQSSSKRVLSTILCCFVLGVADGSFELSPVSLNSGISSVSWGKLVSFQFTFQNKMNIPSIIL